MGRRNSNTSDLGDSAPKGAGGRRGSFSGNLSRRGSTSEGAPKSPSRSRFEISQCGKFRIFLSLRFYVKSIFDNVEVLKLLFCNFRGFQKSKFRVINELKWQIFNF